MPRPLRIIYSLLTALIFVIGTLQMAYASGQAPALDEMVICTGHSAVTIGIDADGNPTGQIFYCPDCATTALIAVETGNAQIGPSQSIKTATYEVASSSLVTPICAISHPARGPPLSV